MSANVTLVRGLYDALAAGNVPVILGALDPGVEWTEAENFPMAGTYIGPDAVLSNVFTPLVTDWDGFRVTPSEFIDGGVKVVSIGRYSGAYKATGKSMETDFIHVWTLRDGKVTNFRQYVDSGPVQEALRS